MSRVRNSPQKSRASRPRAATTIVFAAFFLSGITSLVYEVIWMRMLAFTFGSTSLAVSAALAAFMAGLAIGCYVFGRIADRVKNHARTYIILEILIGLYGISTLYTLSNLDRIYGPLLQLISGDFYLLTAIRFVLAFVVIGVGAILMGGTLPVISRIVIREKDAIGEQFATLYAVNTFGAVFGALLAGYFLIPSLGLRSGIAVAALINFAIAGLFYFFVVRRQKTIAAQPAKTDIKAGGQAKNPLILNLLVIAFTISGFASLAYQVLWTKALALIIGSSVYAFTIMLATFLFGIAAGSMVMVSLFKRIKQKEYLCFGLIQIGIAFSVLFGAILIGNLPLVFLTMTTWVPHSFFGIQLMEFAVASLAMLPSTLLMGAAFPLVCRIYSGNALEFLGTRIGVVYSTNTIGSVIGAITAGFIFIPFIGTETTLRMLAGLNLLIGLFFLVYGMEKRKKWGWAAGGGAVLAGVLTVVLSPAWNPVLMNSNFPYLVKVLVEQPQVAEMVLAGKSVYTDEDISGSVMVYRMYDGSLNLNLNGHNDGGTYRGDMDVQIEQALLPALIHKAPRRVLLVGLGAGITLGALLQVEEIEEIDLLEISSGAVKANRFFAEYNHNALNDKRVNVIIDDARHFLAHTEKKYDLIINAPSYSWVSGTANIFTRDFYDKARTRLSPGGLFVAWLHLYNITPVDVKRFVKTVNSVFPETGLWLSSSSAELIAIGSEKPYTVDYSSMAQRLKQKTLSDELARVAPPVTGSISRLHLMDAKAVAKYAGDAEINTDDHPVMEFSIPRHMFDWDIRENLRSLTGDASK